MPNGQPYDMNSTNDSIPNGKTMKYGDVIKNYWVLNMYIV